MSDRASFLRTVLGKPYDKQQFNCWHLTSLVQLTLAQRHLPLADPAWISDLRLRSQILLSHPGRSLWQETYQPTDCALVLMAKRGGPAIHVGTWLHNDGGAILHTNRPHGVVLDNPTEVEQVRGWQVSYFVPAVR